MKPAFVETENVRRFHRALDALNRRGAEEACLMVVDGEPGLGKTTALHHWVVQTGAIYLRANAEWRPMWFLNDLLDTLKVKPEHSFEKRFKQAMGALLLRQKEMEMQGRALAIVIDEADHIGRNRKLMETIRDFSDGGNIPFVLVGMGTLRDNLARYPQIASRVSQFVAFRTAERSDLEAFVERICDAKVAPCLIEFIHRAYGGYNREIKEAIKTIEHFASRNNKGGPEAPITLADMAGQARPRTADRSSYPDRRQNPAHRTLAAARRGRADPLPCNANGVVDPVAPVPIGRP